MRRPLLSLLACLAACAPDGPIDLEKHCDAPPEQVRDWIESAKEVDGVIGVMYTTWRRRFDDLERFADLVRESAGASK